MDPELVAWLDRRFEQLKRELKQELREESRADLTATAASLREEFRADLAATATSLREEFRTDLAATATSLRAEVAASAAESRRHFGALAEDILSTVRLVAESVVGVDEKLDRFAGEVREEFRRIDRRFLGRL